MKSVQQIVLLLGMVLATAVSAQTKMSDKEMFDNGHVLTSKDIRFAPIPDRGDNNKISLYSIMNKGTETIVTFVQPIYFDSQWVSYGYGFQIRDRKSGDIYKVRGYEGDLPMNRLLIVKGCNQKNILISLRFPRLKNRVKVVDIIETPHEKDLIPSNNNGIRFKALGIKVKDYKKKELRQGRIYE